MAHSNLLIFNLMLRARLYQSIPTRLVQEKGGCLLCDFEKRRMKGEDPDPPLHIMVKSIQGLSKGLDGRECESLALAGIQLLHARNGFFRCNFIVPIRLADEDGNWEVGAMATLIDSLGAAAAYSVAGHFKGTLDLSVSFYSTAKIQEEVEIEAKVVGKKGKLISVQVEVRRKGKGELIALGRLWTVGSQGSKL